jgi:integral membrane protein (TIGR01906 family)
VVPEVLAPAGLTQALRIVGTILVAFALPVLLLTQSVRAVTLDTDFYMREFAKYHIGQVTRLSDPQLRGITQGFVDYFQAPPGPIDLYVTLAGHDQALFNDREVQHMVDVQTLMERVFQARFMASIALMLGIVAIAAGGLTSAGPALARAGLIGGGITVLLIGLLALGSMIDFETLFLQFHYLSFSNSLWLLDPATDRLIQLFPEGFFYDAALRIGLQTVGEGIVIGIGSAIALRFIG